MDINKIKIEKNVSKAIENLSKKDQENIMHIYNIMNDKAFQRLILNLGDDNMKHLFMILFDNDKIEPIKKFGDTWIERFIYVYKKDKKLLDLIELYYSVFKKTR